MASTENDLKSILAEKVQGGISTTEIIAIALSILWLLATVAFFTFVPATPSDAPFDSLRFVMTLMAVFLPIALIWVGATAAKSTRIMREESRRLQAAIDGMRQSYLSDRQAQGVSGGGATVEKKLDEIAQATKQTETALATFATTRTQPRQPLPPAHPTVAGDDQPSLELGTPAEDLGPQLDRDDMIRALNFPNTDQDEEGFTALRRALKERKARQLIQAAQDVLTLLSQDGIYMDDLTPDRARPEIWRRFAHGERGKVIASLGGIRDRSSLALTAGRMREDAIFRDAAHHFLRLFDKMLAEFEDDATDEQVSNLSETRSARAFMLLGRVAGTFD